MLKPDVRRAILRDGRFRNIARNFAYLDAPAGGARRDTDPIW
jgi:hypothetical protein